MISRRMLEAATALLTGAFGAAVFISSIDNGIGWSRAGVDAGTFPFVVGVVIFAGSLYNLVKGWPGNQTILLQADDLRRVATLFVPAAIFVGLIPLTGMVVASAAYVFAAINWQKRGGYLFAAAVAIATAVALYLIFELTFQISLPRGMLGDALGF
jgi:tripartite tricarboxylate transporter TctB family protein